MAELRAGGRERLLTFEVGGAAYALPISGVLEVADVEAVACVPTLSRGLAGVVNHHGDALPLVERARLLELDDAELPAPKQILVVCARSDTARLGLPVDRVLGLVDGPTEPGRPGAVAERCSVDGRLVNVLDPQRLVTRARQVIEHASSPPIE